MKLKKLTRLNQIKMGKYYIFQFKDSENAPGIVKAGYI